VAKSAPNTSLRDNIIRLFRDDSAPPAETPLGALRETASTHAMTASAVDLDLTGRPKLVMTLGPGRCGKSLLLRWISERSLEHNVPLILATADAARPTLKLFFPETMAPASATTSVSFLERLVAGVISAPQTVALDMGGDQTLVPLLRTIPDLADKLEDAGVSPVVMYMLTPRSSDLTVLDRMVESGFHARATMLVLNMATMDTDEPVREFAQLRRHSAYKAMIDRGAVEVWMPKLWAAKAIEDRTMSLYRAATPAGGLNLFDQSRAFTWLQEMETAFAHCASWLP
jgi:hypothetical protein